jgi:hypothetical protein
VLRRKQFSLYVTKMKKRQSAVNLLPAVVAASAALPLFWQTGKEDLFYDHQNMWLKRCFSTV